MPRAVVNRVQPIERFPTNPRGDGRFQKRIRGKLYYFGNGDGNRTTALAAYDSVKHDLYAGRAPRAWRERAQAVDGETVKDICNRYLADRLAEVDAGKITRRHYDDIQRILHRFCTFKTAGMTIAARAANDIGPDDFSAYARHLHHLKLGNHAYNRERASIYACFRHAVACDWLDKPIKFGRGFQKISAGKMRNDRTPKLMTPIHVKSLLVAASPQLWCMFMLGITGGFGPGDCCKLKTAEIDFDGAFIRSRRSKTKIRRDTPLIPELVAGLRLVLAGRPGDAFVFRTVRGKPWDTTDVCHEFSKILKGFAPYDLRRAFITYANETGDRDAVRRIVGWKLEAMNDIYVQTLFDARLRKVTEHVRSRVLG